MKKAIISLLFLFLVTFSLAQEINVYEFSQLGCHYCEELDASGILEKVNKIENVTVVKYLLNEKEGMEFYSELKEKLDFSAGTPTVLIESEGKYIRLTGSTNVIENIEESIINFEKYSEYPNGGGSKQGLTIGAILLAGIVDSINPCAFGVLIFLMISLLNLGSRKRALKYGLLYSLIIFITYFVAGLGIFRVLQQFSGIRNTIYIFVGAFVFLIGLIEFYDYLKARKGKGATLKISPKIKPFIESKSKQGTITAILALGIVVALFELPCTGGIYLGIISLLLEAKTLGIFYLLIYNLIFVLPLIVLTFLIYKGMSPELIQKWNTKEKAWMRLAASIIMILIAVWLISIGI
jgi:cytochrome c biogenesis protein CcdA